MEEETDDYEEATGAQPMTDYEKQRLSRIRENEVRLEALGLRRLAASPLLRSPPPATKRKQKKRSAEADEEYLPPDDGGEGQGCSSPSGEDDEEEESKSSSRSCKKGKKKKSNSGKTSNRTCKKGNAFVTDFVDDDAALQQIHNKAHMQAIALSLAESVEGSVTAMGAESSSPGIKGSDGTSRRKNGAASNQDTAKNRKTKKLGKSKIQLTEDEVIAFFFSFDEVGKGYITPWDLERMARTNDFIWTDFEISNMIRCFDSNRDGKINIEDFRTIVSRCNMLQVPEE